MATASAVLDAKLNRSPGMIGMVCFGAVLLIGVVYSAFHLLGDLSGVHSATKSFTPARFAIVAAVSGLSPVIMTVRTPIL